MNNMDECAQICTGILASDPNNESASVMMADLSFRQVSTYIAERYNFLRNSCGFLGEFTRNA